MTLWIMALLSVLAIGFAFSTRKAGALVRNFKQETLAYEAALKAFEEARTYILEDRDMTIDFSGPDGAFRTDAERPPHDGAREINGIKVNVRITDEESRLNINMLDEVGLLSALKSSGVPDEEMQGIADSILDWTDADNLHRLGGAEDFYYERLDNPYASKDSPFETIGELALVKGVRPEYVFSPDDGQEAGLSRLLTPFGDGININTSPRENLIASGMDPVLADYILSFRADGGQGLRALPQGVNLPVRPTASSNNFRISVSAAIPDSERVYNIVSILRRVRDEKGIRLQTAYWKETFGYGGD